MSTNGKLGKARNVFVTGGTGSIGQAIVEAFSKNKDNVTFQYSSNLEVKVKLEKNFGATGLKIDFFKSFSLPSPKFDIVVNNAGINVSTTKTHKVSLKNLKKTLSVNLIAAFKILKECLPYMINQKWGRIINISSIYGLSAEPGYLPYTVSKHALSGMTKTIAKEYTNLGITCNEICPGPVDSVMVREVSKRKIKEDGFTLDKYLEEICEEIPAKRMAKPNEIASLAIFLSSFEASYISGASIRIDGGFLA